MPGRGERGGHLPVLQHHREAAGRRPQVVPDQRHLLRPAEGAGREPPAGTAAEVHGSRRPRSPFQQVGPPAGRGELVRPFFFFFFFQEFFAIFILYAEFETRLFDLHSSVH